MRDLDGAISCNAFCEQIILELPAWRCQLVFIKSDGFMTCQVAMCVLLECLKQWRSVHVLENRTTFLYHVRECMEKTISGTNVGLSFCPSTARPIEKPASFTRYFQTGFQMYGFGKEDTYCQPFIFQPFIVRNTTHGFGHLVLHIFRFSSHVTWVK